MKTKLLTSLLLSAGIAFAAPGSIRLQGLPIQLEWSDVDGDGALDLVALMLVSQTEGQVDTYFEEGRLHGLYEDITRKEKYLVTLLQRGGQWEESSRIDLAKQTVLGFMLTADTPRELNLWTGKGLTRHRWTGKSWDAFQLLPPKGLLAEEGASLSGFPFWHQTAHGPVWLVPDLQGIHMVSAEHAFKSRTMIYPEFTLSRNRQNEHRHQLVLALPRLFQVDGRGTPELVFAGEDYAEAWDLNSGTVTAKSSIEGMLMDLNQDGFVDLIHPEMNDDIERRRDLPKVTTQVKTYLATGPLEFPEQPTADQEVPGWLIQDEDSDITIAQPFHDFNRDGLMDLAGVAFKFSFWQIAKVLTVGRFTINFLLNISIQQQDGSFKTLAGGPYKMRWTINIRKLKMPELAQMTADFNGDGWSDLMLPKGKRLQITPLGQRGFGHDQAYSLKIPAGFKRPDQVFGRDITGDGKAEVILMKINRGTTSLGFLGGGR